MHVEFLAAKNSAVLFISTNHNFRITFGFRPQIPPVTSFFHVKGSLGESHIPVIVIITCNLLGKSVFC